MHRRSCVLLGEGCHLPNICGRSVRDESQGLGNSDGVCRWLFLRCARRDLIAGLDPSCGGHDGAGCSPNPQVAAGPGELDVRRRVTGVDQEGRASLCTVDLAAKSTAILRGWAD